MTHFCFSLPLGHTLAGEPAQRRTWKIIRQPDLALATQALSYLKPDLAFDISKVYTQQNAFQTLENSFLASTFTPASMSSDNRKDLATVMMFHLIDVNQQQPAILQLYGKVIPEVNSALSH